MKKVETTYPVAKTHPTLYKRSSVGKIQQWTIAVVGNTIVTVFGQLDGKKQETKDVVKEGKNPGKANATTPEQQAHAEALAKWTKQKKTKGYVENMADAAEGKRDALVKGGIDPMLAHKHSEQGKKIKYPAYSQPKFDGIRCIAVLKDGECTLWTRTRKPILGVPHVQREIERRFEEDIILDGELYCHALKAHFEKIVHYVRQEEPADGHEIVEFHIYDIVEDEPFAKRNANLSTMVKVFLGPLKQVRTDRVVSEEELLEKCAEYIEDGYEGGMVRNADGKYANKRSYDLQKIKEFEDDDFPITGVTEGRGKLAGHAIFVCSTGEGNPFEAKLRGDTSALKLYWENSALWEGKKLTVRYQGYTKTNNVPRFPVGVAVRDYE